MSETMLATLSNIRTVEDMIVAFEDEQHCRRLEARTAVSASNQP